MKLKRYLVNVVIFAMVIAPLWFAVTRLHRPARTHVVAFERGALPVLHQGEIAARHETGVAVASDGSVVAVCTSRSTLIYRDRRIAPKELEGGYGATQIALTPDNQKVVGLMASGGLAIWDVKTGKRVKRLRGRREMSGALAISRDSMLAAFGGESGLIEIWDIKSGDLVRKTRPEQEKKVVGFNGDTYKNGSVSDLAFSPDQRYLASGSVGGPSIRIWDVATGNLVREIGNSARSLVWGDDSKTLIETTDLQGCEGWNIPSGKWMKFRARVRDHFGHPMLPPVVMDDHGKLAHFSLLGKIERFSIGSDEPSSVSLEQWNAFHSDGRSAGMDYHARFAVLREKAGSLKVWSAESGRVLWEIQSGA